MDRIGFVGASGLMGRGMAANLLKAGHALAYTVHRSPLDDLAAAGGAQVDDLAELGATCDVVVICVTAASDVEEVVTGLLERPRAGLVVVDSSTSEPAVTRRLGAACADRGVTLVDAPLTRGPKEAAEGRLNVLVGADADVLERLRPVFAAVAENVFHCGPLGAGHTVKLLNNFVVQAAATALAEAFAVATRAGADPRILADVLAAGPFANPLLGNIARTLDGDYDGMVFALDNARKDVRYYTRLAGEQGVPSVVGDGVHEALALASALGFGAEYVPALVKAQEKLIGGPIRGGGAASEPRA